MSERQLCESADRRHPVFGAAVPPLLSRRRNCNEEFQLRKCGGSRGCQTPPILYVDMVMTLLEELYIRLENDADQLLVSHLRGELTARARHGFRDDEWDNPRSTLQRFLVTGRSNHVLRITYRGLRRIEELREVLRRERILEDFGVLLSIRYLNADLEHAVQRSDRAPVSVICADMDGFKAVNDGFGHAAGDVVMKAYLESVSGIRLACSATRIAVRVTRWWR